MNISLSFRKALSLWPDKIALVDENGSFTYRQFGQRVYKLMRALSAAGVKAGHRVAVMAPNCHQFMEIYYACALSRAPVVPINFRLSAAETAAILEDSMPAVLVGHHDFEDTIGPALGLTTTSPALWWIGPGSIPELDAWSCQYEDMLAGESDAPLNLPEPAAGDLAQLYYTSGTTGGAKGVMLTHGNVSVHALSAVAELSLSDADTWLHAAPMFHLADAWATFAITWVGGAHVFLPYFRALEALRLLEKELITITNLIPTMLTAMLNCPQADDFHRFRLRLILSGGAPIAPETVRRIIAHFNCDYAQTYGMTETSPYLTLSLLKEHMRKYPPKRQLTLKCRTGRPFMGVDLKVVREDGSEVEPNDQEVGEIIVRGPTVTPGYWGKPELTAEVLRDSWLHTGDLAVIDNEGYVNIVDRKKDMIITGGENVYSTEVEHVIYEHPAVAECAVFGIADKQWGEVVTAAVVLRAHEKLSESELISFVRKKIAAYKSPKKVIFMPELPKTGSGKIMKKSLRDRHNCQKALP